MSAGTPFRTFLTDTGIKERVLKGIRIQNLLRDYGAGLAGSIVLGGAAYLIGTFGFGAIAERSGTLVAAILSALAIGLLSFAVVIGGGEPIFRLAKREQPELAHFARKQIWKGAFLGAPAVIALLSVAEMDWTGIMSTPYGNPLFSILVLVLGVVQYVATAPLRLLVFKLGIPSEVVMIVAMPVGAVIVRYYGNLTGRQEPSPERSPQTPMEKSS